MVKCICTSDLHGHAPGACQSEGLAPDVLCPKCNVQQPAKMVTAVSTGGFFSNATATISSVILQPFGNSYVEIKAPEQATTTQWVEAPNPSGNLLHLRIGAAPKASGSGKPALVPVDSSFKLILFIVLGVSILAIIAAAVAAQFWTTPTPNQQRVFEALEWAYKLGIGAIIGLISGQAARKP
jgi:hypothetical protein